MSEYEQSTTVRASADAVLAFAADVRNLPKYLPTTHHAEPQGEERVAVAGEAKGHRYQADGYLRADRERRRLEWGADEGYYSGWLQVEPADGGASRVTVHLSMRAKPGDGTSRQPSDADVEEGLRAGLESIRNHVEGGREARKEEPRAAT